MGAAADGRCVTGTTDLCVRERACDEGLLFCTLLNQTKPDQAWIMALSSETSGVWELTRGPPKQPVGQVELPACEQLWQLPSQVARKNLSGGAGL